jgi:NADH-quinone oxidoreductase subunit G
VLATWRLALDDSRAIDGEPFLLATARPPVARLHPATADAAGLVDAVTVGSGRGSVTFPLVRDPAMLQGVVWVPAKTPGRGIAEHLGVGAGELVTLSVPSAVVAAGSAA